MPYTFTVPETEMYDEENNRFIFVKEQTLTIEHSLISISKWESKWHKPFISKQELTTEETLDYVRCMTLTQNVKSETYLAITPRILRDILEYMKDPMTGTRFREDPNAPKPKPKDISSEEIYYDMAALNIPFDPCEKWHINRLITLIRVASEKNNPKKKKMTAKERSALNNSRRKKYNTRG